MPFRRGGARKRRDALEPAVRQALHAVGVQTWQLHGVGLPDLLCWFRGQAFVMELKGLDTPITAAQTNCPWPRVYSIPEALAVVGINVPTTQGAG